MTFQVFKKKRTVTLEQLPDASVLEEELVKVRYRTRYRKTLFSTIFTLVSVAAVSILISTFWLPVLQIYGSSMTPTLKEGEVVVSLRQKQFAQGDMIAFYYNNKVLVKRVIATAGQWINIDQDGTVNVDGKDLEETYISEKALGATNIKLPYQVPEGKVFVMGDHRSVSVDSRNTAIGDVSEEQMIGRLAYRVWPLQRFGKID